MNTSHGCACGTTCSCKNCTCSAQARCFDALGNETRLQLVTVLRNGPATVTELSEQTGTEQSLASHSLKTLEACRLVTGEQDGRHRRYRLTETVEPLLQLIDDHTAKTPISTVKACCCH